MKLYLEYRNGERTWYFYNNVRINSLEIYASGNRVEITVPLYDLLKAELDGEVIYVDKRRTR